MAAYLKKKSTNSIDPLTHYFRDITDYELLTRKEELALGRRIQKSIDRKTGKIKDVEALHKLIVSNLRLVVKVALTFRKPHRNFLDLINEGNCGLIIAASRFNPKMGTRFSSYAVWWIRQGIMRNLTNIDHIISVPPQIGQLRARFGRMIADLEDPTIRINLEEAATTLHANKDQMAAVMALERPIVPLDGMICDGRPISDAMEQSYYRPQDQEVAKQELNQRVKNLLADLRPKEQAVLTLRFGLRDEIPRTLSEIGEILHLSRERIRQIEKASLTKLRANRAAKKPVLDLLAAV